jgi:glucose/arabinose dehydrogenase
MGTKEGQSDDMQRVKPIQLLVVFCLSMSMLSCQAPPATPISAPLSKPHVTLTKLTEGFDFSVKMTRLPDGAFLVTEKNTGFVRQVSPTFQLQPEPVIDVAVNHASERGLLGIAAHPEFSRNRYVYILYVASDSDRDTDNPKAVRDIRVVRFQLDGDGMAQRPETLITLPVRPGPYHNGGCILFGPDHKLYVSLGELNRHANIVSQLKGNPRGKILRYNDDGRIPADNPFGADNPIYVYGLRNTFGFSFDRQGRGLFVSDNGPRGHDKLVKAMPGENLGWPLIWGAVDRWYERLAARFLGRAYRSPSWESVEKSMAPTAVGVMPNDFYGPNMAGRILLGGFVETGVRQFTLDAATMSRATGYGFFLDDISTTVDMQFDATGRLYILTMNALYRVDPELPPLTLGVR